MRRVERSHSGLSSEWYFLLKTHAAYLYAKYLNPIYREKNNGTRRSSSCSSRAVWARPGLSSDALSPLVSCQHQSHRFPLQYFLISGSCHPWKSPHSWPRLGTHGGDSRGCFCTATVSMTTHLLGSRYQKRQNGTKADAQGRPKSTHVLALGSEIQALQKTKALEYLGSCLQWPALADALGISRCWGF